MDIRGKLVGRKFTTPEGQERDYYVIEINLADGSTLELPIKGDKARLLIMSQAIQGK